MSDTEEPKSLRASLEDAFAAAESEAAPEVTTESPANGAGKTSDGGAADTKSAASPEPSRDEHGRFAKKLEGVQAPEPQIKPTTSAQAEPEAQPEPIRPPASWSAQAKADFATLAPHIQQEVLKREADVSKGFEERAKQLQRYEPLEQVIAPHRNRLALNGVTEAQYFGSLIAADEMLRGPNPIQALAQIAQMYGVDLRQLAQPGQPQQPQAQLPPQVQGLMQEVSQLKATLTQQTTAAQQAEQARLQADIDAFAKDHLYFEDVRSQMSALIRTGQATDLKDAYEQACWADKTIRPLMLAEQQKAQASAASEAARAKASAAKRAGVSITGSPAPGSEAQRTGPRPSIRESLERQLAARV